MAQTKNAVRNSELAAFLKTRRTALDPRASGVVVGPRRRATGLLREEVAARAGVSVTWYTWLEQGRAIHPSAEVLESLAGALRLSRAERKHLYRLARPDLETAATSALTDRLSPPLEASLNGLAPHAAYAVNGRWDVIAANLPARRLFGSFSGPHECEGNVLARLLLDPGWRSLFADHSRLVQSAVAQFRAATAHRRGDPAVRQLVASLSMRSATFSTLWSRGDVTEPPSWQKTLRHPVAGLLQLDYATFHPDEAPEDVRFTVYTPANDATRDALGRLIA